jgi:hypothetical protein
MHQHIKLLGILNIIYGSIGILIGLLVFAIFGGLAGFITSVEGGPEAEVAAPVLGLIGIFVLGLLTVVSAPAIIAGAGLLGFNNWARILTIVLSAVHLLSVPFGTALGIYGLWVLLKPESEILFRAPARPMPGVPTRPNF